MEKRGETKQVFLKIALFLKKCDGFRLILANFMGAITKDPKL